MKRINKSELRANAKKYPLLTRVFLLLCLLLSPIGILAWSLGCGLQFAWKTLKAELSVIPKQLPRILAAIFLPWEG